LESNRPGTLERRGLGPDVLLRRNPRLVYTRLTGWGQRGPNASKVGHDINYIAGAGLLGAIASVDDERPIPPMNVLGDFASGSLMAALGTIMALFERERTGVGQVVDAAMVDGGAMLLSAQIHEFNVGSWNGRGKTSLSGAAPFYGTYRCADGGWFAVGAIELRFYRAFLSALGLLDEPVEREWEQANWPSLRSRVARVFETKSRDEWTEVFEHIDGCGGPVLELEELADDPHLSERGTVVRHDGTIRVATAPRLSRHDRSADTRPLPAASGAGNVTSAVLLENGFTSDEVRELLAAATIC
jgi:alpha-methylacyl-CoA racemase